jgi:hypothetical protein
MHNELRSWSWPVWAYVAMVACASDPSPLGRRDAAVPADSAADGGARDASAASGADATSADVANLDAASPDTGGADASDGAGSPVDGGAPLAPPASWRRFVGAHYSAGGRAWAGGGLRDPGGVRTKYTLARGADGLLEDEGLTTFVSRAAPEIGAQIGAGREVVLVVGGLTAGESARLYYETITSSAGLAAFQASFRERIRALPPSAAAWPEKLYFQFGNEIQNPNGFYGEVCALVTGGAPGPCDEDTEFLPTYVEYFLAPGVFVLDELSAESLGARGRIHRMLGSIVGLAGRRAFLDKLLRYEVRGTVVPSLRGRRVHELVDTVSVHYSMVAPSYRADFDAFADTWLVAPPQGSAVRALFNTEEVGQRAGDSGVGYAAALRAIVRGLSWWGSRGLGPDRAHLFVWGAEVRCDGCGSVDDDLPAFSDFVGDAPVEERSLQTTPSGVEVHDLAVLGAHDRVVVLLGPDRAAGDVAEHRWSADDVRAYAVTAHSTGDGTPMRPLVLAAPERTPEGWRLPLGVTVPARGAVVVLLRGQP